jgi:hypothetical protein
MGIAASYRARTSSAGTNSKRVSTRYSEKTAAIARMRQINQNGGIASLPEIDVDSAALSVDNGLDKEDSLGQIDDQEDDSIIASGSVEVGEGGVRGEESRAQLSPARRVQSLVEGLSAEEANLEIADADITESALADFSGYQVAFRAHLEERQVLMAPPEESPSDEQTEDDTENCIDAAEESTARAQSMELYKIGEFPEENVELPMDKVFRGWRAAKVPLRVLFDEDMAGKLAPMTTIE